MVLLERFLGCCIWRNVILKIRASSVMLGFDVSIRFVIND
jgi:hypothetical protein